MDKILVCLKDAKSRTWFPPSVVDTEDMAKRQFAALVNSEDKSLPATYPADFDLFGVGVWNDDTGKIESWPAPDHIANGLDVKVS